MSPHCPQPGFGAVDSEAVQDLPGAPHSVAEKEAVFSFPDNEGVFDYVGFVSSDETVLGWCKDVFDYYWEKAKTINLL